MKSKNVLPIVVIILVIGLVIAGLIWLIISLTSEGKTIDVQGMATVKKEADKVWMSVGVVTEADAASEAESENTRISNKIYAGLNSLGLTSKDYKTESYNVRPNRDWREEGKITGYTVEHRIRIDTDKIELAGAILDKAVEAGANSIYGVNFDLSTTSRELARAEALKTATQIARQKAEGIASGLGVRITGIKSVSDSSVNYYPYRFMDIGVEKVMAEGGENIITESGSVEVTATVFVSYKFA